jgi:hypothetical protein
MNLLLIYNNIEVHVGPRLFLLTLIANRSAFTVTDPNKGPGEVPTDDLRELTKKVLGLNSLVNKIQGGVRRLYFMRQIPALRILQPRRTLQHLQLLAAQGPDLWSPCGSHCTVVWRSL